MFGKKKAEIDRLTGDNESLRSELIFKDAVFGEASSKQKVLADALNQENADLVYRLELYESVLRQLRVPVSLPARKK